jgi:hypothetical protein
MYIFIFRRNLFGYIAGDFFTNPSRHSVTNPIPNHEAVDSEIFLCKEVARGGEQTRGLSILFILSFSPLYRSATAAPPIRKRLTTKTNLKIFRCPGWRLGIVVIASAIRK